MINGWIKSVGDDNLERFISLYSSSSLEINENHYNGSIDAESQSRLIAKNIISDGFQSTLLFHDDFKHQVYDKAMSIV